MPKVDNFLKYAISVGASDLHLSVGMPPLIRVHGALKPLKAAALDARETVALIGEILKAEQKEAFTQNLDLDLCYDAPQVGRFRVNVLKQRKGVNAVFRIIPSRVSSLEDLGFPPAVNGLLRHHQGMVLVTGPSGCGKSTTLAAMIDSINRSKKVHIITVEDPIEYVHPNLLANVTQREVRRHTESFSSALRAALREDPDVILIGEMRDLETVQMAITAAETGHLVLATLHTRNSSKTVDRIIDVFPPSQQNQVRTMVSESLRGVVCQQLIPKIDGSGRALAYEILIATPAVANMIREGKTFQIPTMMQTGLREGMVLMDHSLAKLVTSRAISSEVALQRAENKKLIPRG